MNLFLQLLVNGIIVGGVYALLAVSFSFVYSATKFFNLAHGSVGVVAAYSVYFLSKEQGLPLWLGIVSGILVASVLGWIMNRVVYAPLRARKASSMVLLVASLGVLIVIQSIIAMVFTSNFRTIAGASLSRGYELGGIYFTLLHIVIILTAIVVSGLLVLLLKKTLFGKAVNAVSDDEEVSTIVGINTDKIIAWVFFIGSGIAGLGGILFALDTGIQPTSDLDLLLKAVIASIIGGVGSLYGALLGAFVLGIVENIGIWFLPSEWKPAIAFGVLIIFLIVRPGGIIRK